MGSEDDLRRAEELVAEARRIVQQQKGRIIRLRAAGVDTWDAERALHLFEANLRRFEETETFSKAKSSYCDALTDIGSARPFRSFTVKAASLRSSPVHSGRECVAPRRVAAGRR
jgi:hypothetical protein